MLPFDAETLVNLHTQYAAAQRLASGAALPLGLAIVLLTFRPSNSGSRLVLFLLAAAWAWVGYFFHLQVFAAFNFLAPIYGAVFFLQALLLLAAAMVGPAFRARGDPPGALGAILALLVVVAALMQVREPALNALWAAGLLSPQLLALFTLAMLLLSVRRLAWLGLIPILWLLVAGWSGWVLGRPLDLVAPLLGLLAFAMLFAKRPALRPPPEA